MSVHLKRVYDAPTGDDGYRVLVDRLWPRGLAKETAQIDAWFKEIAPSSELRKWFDHQPEKWEEFKQRYFQELDDRPGLIGQLIKHASAGRVTLLFAAKEERYNNAVALKEYLERKLD